MLIGNEHVEKIVMSNVGSTFLFVGQEHLGKTTFALEFANKIGRVKQNIIHLVPEKDNISIEVVREMQEKIARPPLRAGDGDPMYCVIIERAECLNSSSANALLKSLEEPSFPTTFFLTAQEKNSVIDTIVSRSFLVLFQPIDSAVVRTEFEDMDFDVPQELAEFICSCIKGRIGLVYQMQDDSSVVVRFERLLRICKAITKFNIKQIHKVVEMFDEKTAAKDLIDVARYFNATAVDSDSFIKNIGICKKLLECVAYIERGCDVKTSLDLMLVEINKIVKGE